MSKPVSQLTRFLLKGPVIFFLLIVNFWKMWRRRWHGFASPPPFLSTQTGKYGVMVSSSATRCPYPVYPAR